MSKDIFEIDHYEIDFRTGECHLVKHSYPYNMDEDILIKDFKCLDIPVVSKIFGNEIIIPKHFTYNKNQFEESDNSSKKKYLLDTYTGKYYKVHGRKICIQTLSTHELQAFNFNGLYYSLGKETQLIRREFIRSNLKELLHKEPQKLAEIYGSIYEDGTYYYYKNFLDKDILKILLNELESKDIKVIYNTCLFAYNNMMDKIEQEQWEKILLDKEIIDLFLFNGGFISNNEISTKESHMELLLDKDVNDLFIFNSASFFNNEIPTREPHILPNVGKDYIIKELTSCIGNILGYENYDITKSKYIKGILRNKEYLKTIIEFDSSEYVAILTNLDKLDVGKIIKKNIRNDYELFELAINGPIIVKTDFHHIYHTTSYSYTGAPSTIMEVVKEYAPDIFDEYIKKRNSTISLTNEKEMEDENHDNAYKNEEEVVEEELEAENEEENIMAGYYVRKR